MKAWSATTKYGEYSAIVFADTASKAKVLAQYTDACEDEPYTSIRVNRMPLLDGMEDREPKGETWHNEEIRLILVRDYGWACVDPTGDECDECCAKQYCHWMEE